MKKADLPISFQNTIVKILGADAEKFFDSLTQQEITSIRFHPRTSWSLDDNMSIIPWEDNAVYLQERPSFAMDPAWHAGKYYVQESSSMLTGYFCKQLFDFPITALDLCAAPGGKSTHLLSVLPQDSLLVSNEIIPKRNHILVENIEKWGFANNIVTRAEAKDFQALEEFFDLVVVDAPCSGEGLFRRQADAVEEWSEENVQTCIHRQSTILQQIHPTIKKGGYLCYSTCTFEEGENEDQVRQLLETGLYELVALPEMEEHGIVKGSLPGTLRCWPHKVKGSGFFIAMLKKVAHSFEEVSSSKKKFWNWNTLKKVEPIVYDFIRKDAQFQIYQSGEYLRAFPYKHYHNLSMVANSLTVTHFGINVGQLKKGIFSPLQGLVHSDLLHPAIPRYQTEDLSIVLDYLRKKDIPIQKDIPMGWAVICYHDQALGWVKQNPQRVNNYYPQHLMLRM